MRFSRYANISHTEESSYNDSIKRKSYYLTDDDDRSGDEIVGYKRRRSEKTNKNHTVLRNVSRYQPNIIKILNIPFFFIIIILACRGGTQFSVILFFCILLW